jgi:arsenate reductase/amino-acid N-acetyltransferase
VVSHGVSAPRPDFSREAPRLEAVDPGDRSFRRCLEQARLATVDLAGSGKAYFRLAVGGESRAFSGFEARGSHALLRSIVVEGRERGHGFGRTLVLGLIAEARKRGLKDAYLLTVTAGPFFATLGFAPCAREAAPAEIAATEQFAELCPANAKLMRRDLAIS